jgi:signal transduction histidine kinase
MRSNLELLRIKPENRFIQSTDDEISNMEHIIESLLFLAKPTRNTNENKKIDIIKITEECIEKYKLQEDIQWEK